MTVFLLFPELNSSLSTQSTEDLKLDLIYIKEVEIDAEEIPFANASSDSNDIPQSYTNWSVPAAAQGKLNNGCHFNANIGKPLGV